MKQIPLSSVNSEVKYTIGGLNTVTQANYQSDDIVRGHFLYSLTYDYSDHNTRIYRSGTNQKNITYSKHDFWCKLLDGGHTQTLTTMWQSYFNDSEWFLVGFDYFTPYYKAQYMKHSNDPKHTKLPTRWANSILCLPVSINDANQKGTVILDYSHYKQITGLNELMQKVGNLNKIKLPKSLIDPYQNYSSNYIPDEILKNRYLPSTVDPDANHIYIPSTEHDSYDDATTLYRSECGISSDGTYMFFAMNDNHRNLYVARFPVANIRNDLINKDTIDISTYNLDKSNTLAISYTNLCQLTSQSRFSFQGFGMDSENNFYISSEFANDYPDNPESSLTDMQPRFIVKIPNMTNNIYTWELVDLTNYKPFKHMYTSYDGTYLDEITEFESVQVVGVNDILLTIAYHKGLEYDEKRSKRKSVIYEITW